MRRLAGDARQSTRRRNTRQLALTTQCDVQIGVSAHDNRSDDRTIVRIPLYGIRAMNHVTKIHSHLLICAVFVRMPT